MFMFAGGERGRVPKIKIARWKIVVLYRECCGGGIGTEGGEAGIMLLPKRLCALLSGSNKLNQQVGGDP